MKNLRLLFVVATFGLAACDRQQPITLHSDNPHYFEYRGKPAVLITSAEHYGAVINLDFDYIPYLETLAADRLNLTRVFSGAYVEPVGAFRIEQNTLAPASGRFICPWGRSETAGYANGGNKFDLAQWDNEYFKRLRDFMREADKRDIIVEFTLFCPFYGDHQWKISPMNPVNNVNGLGPEDRTHVYTLDKSAGLLTVQEDLVRKIVSELKEFDNLIYEICNEPYFGGVTMEWQHHIADIIREAEKDVKHPHLISQNIANGSAVIEHPHPAVSVFNFHYATPPVAVARNYGLNKVIGDNETGFKGNADSTYRKEGWQFLMAGGALYNSLDYSFTANHEDGTFRYPDTQPGGGSAALRKQLAHLQQFMSKLDFVRMKPDSTSLITLPSRRHTWMLSEPGKQYAIYIFGKGPFDLTLTAPDGDYEIEFTDPVSGNMESSRATSSGENLTITTPAYNEDVAVSITRVQAP